MVGEEGDDLAHLVKVERGDAVTLQGPEEREGPDDEAEVTDAVYDIIAEQLDEIL